MNDIRFVETLDELVDGTTDLRVFIDRYGNTTTDVLDGALETLRDDPNVYIGNKPETWT